MAGNPQDQNFFNRHFVPLIGGAGLIYCGINLLSQSGAPEAPLWAGIVGGILLLCGIAALVMAGLQAYREKKEDPEGSRAPAEPEAEVSPVGETTGEEPPQKNFASGGLAEELVLFLAENRSVVDQFKRDSYEKAFQEYREKCAPLCDGFYSLSREEEGVTLLQKECERLLEILENKWKSSARRGIPDFADQQQVALFLIPAFRSLYPEEETDFPNCLRDTWNKRYPKAMIECGTAQDIIAGFQRGFRSILDLLARG